MDNIFNEFIGGELEDDADCYFVGGDDTPHVADSIDSYIRERKAEIDKLDGDPRRIQRAYDALYYTGVSKQDIADWLIEMSGLDTALSYQISCYKLAGKNAIYCAAMDRRGATILPDGAIVIDGITYALKQIPKLQLTDIVIEQPWAKTAAEKLANLRELLHIEAEVAHMVKKLQAEIISEINRMNHDIIQIEYPLRRR